MKFVSLGNQRTFSSVSSGVSCKFEVGQVVIVVRKKVTTVNHGGLCQRAIVLATSSDDENR